MKEFEDFYKLLQTKPQWGKNELLSIVAPLKAIADGESGLDELTALKPYGKKSVVDEIKKYDVLYVSLVGSVHYFIVMRTTEDLAYGILLSSKDNSNFAIHKIEKDRYFKDSFATTTYHSVPMDIAKKSFVRVYENKGEADTIFKIVKEFYKKTFNL